MAVLVGLQTTPLNYSQAFIADYTVGITIVLLQAVLTLTVLSIALSVDSRVPRRFPYCTVLLALSTLDRRLLGGWLLTADSLSWRSRVDSGLRLWTISSTSALHFALHPAVLFCTLSCATLTNFTPKFLS
jgi:hypothetical protein